MHDRSIIAEFLQAFPAVLGPRFWPIAGRLVGILLTLAVVHSTVIDCCDVPSGSMIPTLLVGDRVLVNELAYDLKVPFTTCSLLRWSDPQRGDVVVFVSPQSGLHLVKRVIGLPGDTVELRDNVLYLNRCAANERPINASLVEEAGVIRPHQIEIVPHSPGRATFGPLAVPAGCYFLMGDNRDQSLDSRYFGCIGRGQIIGRCSRVLWSLKDGFHPSFERSLQSIY